MLLGPGSQCLDVLEDGLFWTQRMIRDRTGGALGWPQGSSKLATLFCGQPLANGELLSVSMASCHQPHGVNGEEVGTGGWRNSRMQALLAENQGGGGKNTPCPREINASSKTYNSQVKFFFFLKRRFFNQTVLLSLVLNGRLFTQLSWLQKPGQLKQYVGSTPPSNQKLLAQRNLNRGTDLLGDVFQVTPSNCLNVNPPAGEWHFGK